ncbi:glycosyltransferase family 9 protein [Ideonella sp. B7]|uniref:glycosyltransferase family 9 protein n=1 Tax=Ideonella benzenivorans TaxID=2831643 RepID=UPI001CECD6F2|nr:glycosyltransferase family 9 protein [Ideonella benzenivorans]MCA6217804.1 glycosyltransferase family 9 protein [Ideonella benzenivorans]
MPSPTPTTDTRPRTVVLHQFPGMGDLVWHVPYIRAIAAQSRGGQVAVISAPSTFARDLLAHEDCISEVIDFERHPRGGRRGRHAGLRGVFRMGRELRPHRFDRIVIFSDHANRALMARVAGIPERLGFGASWLERQLLSHGPFIRPYDGPAVSVSKNAAALAMAHGFCTQPLRPTVRLAPTDVAAQAPLLATLPHPLYTFAIGASEPHKQWGATRFAALANALAQRGCGVVLLGGPAEAALAEAIQRDILPAHRPQILSATGNTMRQSAATLALADANIGNDTGITNLAAALDRPSFVLLGNRPLLDHDPLMRMLLPPTPDLPVRRGARPPVRLEDISVADVLARLEQDEAPGFGPAHPQPSGLPTCVDLGSLELAEQVAVIWWAQHRHRLTGETFTVRPAPVDGLDLSAWFPNTFPRRATQAPDPLAVWHPGPVWLTAANAFACHPVAGAIEQLPEPLRRQADALRASAAGQRRVLVHLADPRTRQAVLNALGRQGVLAVDVLAQHPGPDLPETLLVEMLAADAWVGGCAGRDHLWALLRPQTPQLALWPGATQEQAAWAIVQRGLGLSAPWSRWPLNPGLLKVLTAAETPSQHEQEAVLAQLSTLLV